MTLSDAIRLGSMLRPQAFGVYHMDGQSCAIGATAEALKRNPTLVALEIWVLVWGRACPACGEKPTQIQIGMIPHLNDDHRWTREAIADWLATFEQEVAWLNPEVISVHTAART